MTVKLSLLALLATGLLLAGMWLNDLIDEAGQADLLRQQIREQIKQQDHINAVASATENELLTERRKRASFEREWRLIRESPNRSVCALDADTIGLLRKATSAGVPTR